MDADETVSRAVHNSHSMQNDQMQPPSPNATVSNAEPAMDIASPSGLSTCCAFLEFMACHDEAHVELRVAATRPVSLDCKCNLQQGGCVCEMKLHSSPACAYASQCSYCMQYSSVREFMAVATCGLEQEGVVEKSRVLSRNTHPQEITYLVKIKVYQTLLRALLEHAHEGCLRVEALPSFVLKTLTALRSRITRSEQKKRRAKYKESFARGTAFAPTLFRSLHEFQLSGVRHGLNGFFPGRWLLADDMGLGKTLQALAMTACFHHEWPMLIVTPASLRLNWLYEALRWYGGVLPTDVQIVRNRTGFDATKLKKSAITITSYTMLQKLRGHFEGAEFKVIIMDESHRIRSTGSGEHGKEVTQKNVSLLRRAKRVVLCSGTPCLSKPAELWHQLFAMLAPIQDISSSMQLRRSPRKLTSSSSSSSSLAFAGFNGQLGVTMFPGDLTSFQTRYCERKQVTVVIPNVNYDLDAKTNNSSKEIVYTKWRASGASYTEELFFLMRRLFFTRREKSAILQELPPIVRQVLLLDVDDASASKQTARMGSMSRELQTTMARMPGVLRYLGILLPELTQTLADGKRSKVLLFAHHIRVMDELTEYLAKQRICYVRIDGSLSDVEKQDAVHKFRHDEEVLVALCSITATCQGFSFTAAKSAVFVELPQTVSHLLQAEGRIQRLGDEASLVTTKFSYFLVGNLASDHQRWALLNAQKVKVKAVLDNQQDSFLDVNEVHHDSKGVQLATKLVSSSSSTDAPRAGPVISPDKQSENDDWQNWFEAEHSEESVDFHRTVPPAANKKEHDVNVSPPLAVSASLSSSSSASSAPVATCDDADDAVHDIGDEPEHNLSSSSFPSLVFFVAPLVQMTYVCVVSRQCGSQSSRVGQLSCQSHAVVDSLSGQLESALTNDSAFGNVYWAEFERTNEETTPDQRDMRVAAALRHVLADAAAFVRNFECLDIWEQANRSNTYVSSTLQLVHWVTPVAPIEVALSSSTDANAVQLRGIEADDKQPVYERYVERNSVNWAKSVNLKTDGMSLELRCFKGVSATDHRHYRRSDIPESVENLNHPEWLFQLASKTNGHVVCVNAQCKKTYLMDSSWLLKQTLLHPEMWAFQAFFCTNQCYTSFGTKAGSNLRMAVLQRDRGRCRTCEADTMALLRQIQQLPPRSQTRRAALTASYFGSRLSKKHAAQIVNAVEVKSGWFWEADHIVAVHRGGGHSDLTNYQTLCKPCHQEKTSKQSKERTKVRKRRRQQMEAKAFAMPVAPTLTAKQRVAAERQKKAALQASSSSASSSSTAVSENKRPKKRVARALEDSD